MSTETCPGCGRRIGVQHGRFNGHHSAGAVECVMSQMPLPIGGRSDADMEAKAHIVAGLAAQMRDEDPAGVWDYLTAVPAEFVQEVAMLALAGMDTEGKRVQDIWGWVRALPSARFEVSA